ELGVPDFPTAIPGGIEHRWLPLVNGSVPDAGWLARWQPIAQDVLARLRRGERVLLHCRGGRGRVGLVAGLLLRECGLGGEEAILWVREARADALENRLQERFVIDYRPGAALVAVPRRLDTVAWADRFVGSMLGGAV